jgi:hypothetical protein
VKAIDPASDWLARTEKSFPVYPADPWVGAAIGSVEESLSCQLTNPDEARMRKLLPILQMFLADCLPAR